MYYGSCPTNYKQHFCGDCGLELDSEGCNNCSCGDTYYINDKSGFDLCESRSNMNIDIELNGQYPRRIR